MYNKIWEWYMIYVFKFVLLFINCFLFKFVYQWDFFFKVYYRVYDMYKGNVFIIICWVVDK